MNEQEQHENLQYDARDSITLKRNAKGEYAWDIKTYYDAVGGDDDVIKSIVNTDSNLRAAFL